MECDCAFSLLGKYVKCVVNKNINQIVRQDLVKCIELTPFFSSLNHLNFSYLGQAAQDLSQENVIKSSRSHDGIHNSTQPLKRKRKTTEKNNSESWKGGGKKGRKIQKRKAESSVDRRA